MVYPGGPSDSCDSWEEVLAARVEDGNRTIDCEGYAVMGVTLLTIAGFQLVEYINAVPTERWFGNHHAIAYMRMPQGTRGFIYISNAQIYQSLNSALESVGFDPAQTRCGRGDTLREASDEAYWIHVNSRVDTVVDETTRFLRRRIPFM